MTAIAFRWDSILFSELLSCGAMPRVKASWRSIVAIIAVVGGIGAATYPIIVSPYINPDPWSE